MSGPAKSKKRIMNVKVYLHKKDAATGSMTAHIDVESPELNNFIKPGEATYCAGKKGGVFIGLKKPMLKRAAQWLKKRKSQLSSKF